MCFRPWNFGALLRCKGRPSLIRDLLGADFGRECEMKGAREKPSRAGGFIQPSLSTSKFANPKLPMMPFKACVVGKAIGLSGEIPPFLALTGLLGVGGRRFVVG